MSSPTRGIRGGMIKYTVIWDESQISFMEKVTEYLNKHGYKLQGGVAVSVRPDNGKITWHQALTKD